MFGDPTNPDDPTTDPSETPAERAARIQANVAKIRAQGGSDADVQEYVAHEDSAAKPSVSPAPPAPSAAPTQPAPSGGSPLRDVARNVLGQGLLFGFGDEAEAGVRAAVGGEGSFRDRYASAVQAIRDQNKQYDADHPTASFVGKLGGALLPALATGGASLIGDALGGAAEAAPLVEGAETAIQASRVPTVLRNVARAGAYGAGAGAISAAGDADPDPGMSLSDAIQARLGHAAGAAPAAAGFGALMLPLGAASGRAASGMADLMQMGGEAGQARRALGRGADLVLQRVLRSGTGLSAMEADAARLQGANSTIPTAAPTVPAVAKPVTLMDVGGKGVRRLAAAAVATPSRASEALPAMLEDRMARSATRLGRDIEQGTGMPTVSEPSYTQGMRAAAQPGLTAAYDKAWQNTPPIETGPISDILTNPTFQRAEGQARVRNAEELAGGTDVDRTTPMAPLTSRQQLDLPDGSTRPVDVAVPETSAQDLDRVKRMLDDEIGRRQELGDKEGVRTLSLMKNKMLREVDTQAKAGGSADYPQARLLAETLERKIDAFNKGQQILGGTREQPYDAAHMYDDLQNMTSDERTEWRRGAQLAKVAQLRGLKTGRNMADAIMANPEAQDRLKLVIDNPTAWQRFTDALDAERQFGQTRNEVTTGSRTVPLAQDVAEMATGLNAGTMGADAAHAASNPASFVFGKLLQGGAKAYNERILGIRGNVADRIGDLMQAGAKGGAEGQADLQSVFDLLRQRQRLQTSLASRYLPGGFAGGLTTGFGN